MASPQSLVDFLQWAEEDHIDSNVPNSLRRKEGEAIGKAVPTCAGADASSYRPPTPTSSSTTIGSLTQNPSSVFYTPESWTSSVNENELDPPRRKLVNSGTHGYLIPVSSVASNPPTCSSLLFVRTPVGLDEWQSGSKDTRRSDSNLFSRVYDPRYTTGFASREDLAVDLLDGNTRQLRTGDAPGHEIHSQDRYSDRQDIARRSDCHPYGLSASKPPSVLAATQGLLASRNDDERYRHLEGHDIGRDLGGNTQRPSVPVNLPQNGPNLNLGIKDAASPTSSLGIFPWDVLPGAEPLRGEQLTGATESHPATAEKLQLQSDIDKLLQMTNSNHRAAPTVSHGRSDISLPKRPSSCPPFLRRRPCTYQAVRHQWDGEESPSPSSQKQDFIESEHISFCLQGLSSRVDFMLQETRPLSPASSRRAALASTTHSSAASPESQDEAKTIPRARSMPPPWSSNPSGSPARPSTEDPQQARCGSSDGYGATLNLTTGANESTRSSGHGSAFTSGSGTGHGSGSSQQAPSRKRLLGSDDSDQQSMNESNQIKRRKKANEKDSSGTDGRFPCIFFAGEPERYPDDDKRYDHISQLQRHLRSSHHMWLACEKCFTEFNSINEQQQHCRFGINDCIKSCEAQSCRRRRRRTSPPQVCRCITTSEAQWQALFRLKYPDKEVPGITGAARSHDLPGNFAINSSLQPKGSSGAGVARGDMPSVFNPSMHAGCDMPVPTTEPSMASDSLFAVPSLGIASSTYSSELSRPQGQVVLDLHKKIRLLEQRLAQPNKRQREIENLFGLVWEAFEATDSPQAQPGSRLHMLVSEMVPSVTSGSAMEVSKKAPVNYPPLAVCGDMDWGYKQQAAVDQFPIVQQPGQHEAFDLLQFPGAQDNVFASGDFLQGLDPYPELDAIIANFPDFSNGDAADPAYGSNRK